MGSNSRGNLAPTKTPFVKFYNFDDSGPFSVILESKSSDLNIENIHPIKIGRELRKKATPGVSKITKK